MSDPRLQRFRFRSQQTPGPDHAELTYDIVGEDKVEPKTKAATVAAGAGSIVTGFVLYLLDAVFWNGENEPPVPLPVQLFVGLLVATGLTFAASYYARHVNRPNPPKDDAVP